MDASSPRFLARPILTPSDVRLAFVLDGIIVIVELRKQSTDGAANKSPTLINLPKAFVG